GHTEHPLGPVQATAVAHEQPAGRVGHDVARRGHPVLERASGHARSVAPEQRATFVPPTAGYALGMEQTVRQIGNVVVTRDTSVTGVATDRDIVVRGIAEGRDPATTRLAEIVSGPVVRVGVDSPISDAVALMRQHAVRRLVVTDGDGG